MHIPDPPQFSGEPGKDHLKAFIHDLNAWYYGARSTTTVQPVGLFNLIRHRAFPFESLAARWFKRQSDRILSEATAPGAGEDAYLHLTVAALEKQYAYLAGDKEMQLNAMQLKSGEDAAKFTMLFDDLVQEVGWSDEKAVRQLKHAVSRNAPGLAAQIESDLWRKDTVSLQDVVQLADRYSRNLTLDGHRRDPGVDVPKREAMPKRVQPDSVCPLHGGHPISECRTLNAALKQRAPTQHRQVHSTQSASRPWEETVADLVVQRIDARYAPPPPPPPMAAVSGSWRSSQDARASALHGMGRAQMSSSRMPTAYPYPPTTSHVPPPSMPAHLALPPPPPRQATHTTTQVPRPHTQQGGGRAPYVRNNCRECGRVHHPQAPCYGRNWEKYPNNNNTQAPHALLTEYEADDTMYTSNADLSWPPMESMCTMQIGGDPLVSAAAPVPFSAPALDLSITGARAEGSKTQAPPPTQRLQPNPAVVQISAGELGLDGFASLLKVKPESKVCIELNDKTVAALLKRTGVLGAPDPGERVAEPLHTAAAACAPFATTPVTKPVAEYAGALNADVAARDRYLSQSAGLYRLNGGFTITYGGRSLSGFNKILYDTGSEVGLMSQRYADANGIKYVSSGLQVSTSLGGTGSVIGKVDAPVKCVLNEGTAVSCSTFSAAATQFLVVQGVEHMYDILLSTHCARDWGARPDPVVQLLEYRPFLVQGDLHTMASVPLLSTNSRTWRDAVAAGVFVCGVTQESGLSHTIEPAAVAESAAVPSDELHCLSTPTAAAIMRENPCFEPQRKKQPKRVKKGVRVITHTQVRTQKRPQSSSDTHKRKGYREQRTIGKGRARKMADAPKSCSKTAPTRVSKLSVLDLLLLILFLKSLPDVMSVWPQPVDVKGKLGPVGVIPGVWKTIKNPQCFTTTINSTQPDGNTTVPMGEGMAKDPELGVVWGNHPDTSPSYRERLRTLVLEKKNTTFAYSVDDLGTYTGEVGPFRIDLHHDQPIMARRRRKSPLEFDIQDEKCGELEKAGLIKPAPPGSKYASEVVLPVKKDSEGNYTDRRFCVDFREINAATEADRYGMHLADEIFREISGHKFFSKIDLRSGFHQIMVHVPDQAKTGFWWQNKIYMYTRMPFGARNATAHFQRVMDAEIAKAGLQKNVSSFVDDILIYSKKAEEHLRHIRQTFDMLQGCGLKAHPDKTVLCSHTVEFLGHNVSERGLTTNEAKVAAIKALHPPTNVSQLRSVLGFIGYYRCYIPNFSRIANPLNGLLKRSASWEWNAEHQTALDTLKAEVSTPGRVLKHQDPNRPLILHTDWSKEGIGAILGQIDDKGNEYMVACISRSLNVHEKNYSSSQEGSGTRSV